MKAFAARQETDGDDLKELGTALGITTPQAALDLIERFYGRSRISLKTQLIVEVLFGDDN